MRIEDSCLAKINSHSPRFFKKKLSTSCKKPKNYNNNVYPVYYFETIDLVICGSGRPNTLTSISLFTSHLHHAF